jgi:hypothetical protein
VSRLEFKINERVARREDKRLSFSNSSLFSRQKAESDDLSFDLLTPWVHSHTRAPLRYSTPHLQRDTSNKPRYWRDTCRAT